MAGGAPVGLEVANGLVHVVCRGVDSRVLRGAAHGVGQLSSAAGGEDVGAIVGGALGSVDGEGVAVVQVLGVDLFAAQGRLTAMSLGSKRRRWPHCM
jgi:hypothetical protein